MKIKTIDEPEVLREGLRVLLENLPHSKVARLLALWKVGHGDYASSRQELFEGDSIEALFTEALRLQDKAIPLKSRRKTDKLAS